MEDGSIKVLKVSETKAFDMEGALKQVQKRIDGGMKTKEAIKRVAQEMNGSKMSCMMLIINTFDLAKAGSFF